jgi:hypothetical protein
VHVILGVDATTAGDVVREVTTDSNLQEFLTTKVSGDRLTVNSERFGGVGPTEGFDVSGTVAVIEDISVDNGARVKVTGSVGNVTLSANNGAQLDAGAFEAATVEVDADNGAQITVWATDDVSGEVTNGADLTVLCGGSMRVNSSDGGSVSSSP